MDQFGRDQLKYASAYMPGYRQRQAEKRNLVYSDSGRTAIIPKRTNKEFDPNTFCLMPHKLTLTVILGQRCLSKTHWSYECKSQPTYIPRPSPSSLLKQGATQRRSPKPMKMESPSSPSSPSSPKPQNDKNSEKDHKEESTRLRSRSYSGSDIDSGSSYSGSGSGSDSN